VNDENENIDKNEILVEDYISSDGIVEIHDNQYASLIDKIKKQFNLVGIKDEVIFKTISDGLQANKMFIDKFGDEHVEPDHIVRHKYLLTALELLQLSIALHLLIVLT
jgi:hypothetical protein